MSDTVSALEAITDRTSAEAARDVVKPTLDDIMARLDAWAGQPA